MMNDEFLCGRHAQLVAEMQLLKMTCNTLQTVLFTLNKEGTDENRKELMTK